MNKTQFIILAVATALLLAPFTTGQHLYCRGSSYLSNQQLRRHHAILDGNAGNPWQYRVLSAYLIEGITRVLAWAEVDWSIIYTFVAFRVIQDALILLLALEYYRQLGMSSDLSFLGVFVLAWGMSYTHYHSDLQFSTFFDVSFYLIAGLLILNDSLAWLIPLIALAAFNRETSGLIVTLPVIMALFERRPLKRPFIASALSGLVYLSVFVALRSFYPSQELIVAPGLKQGMVMLRHNILSIATWRQLVATLGVVPLLALVKYSDWPTRLKAMFWAIVPIWVIIHAFMAVMAESRLFLVPQTMVFIPAALYVVGRSSSM